MAARNGNLSYAPRLVVLAFMTPNARAALPFYENTFSAQVDHDEHVMALRDGNPVAHHTIRLYLELHDRPTTIILADAVQDPAVPPNMLWAVPLLTDPNVRVLVYWPAAEVQNGVANISAYLPGSPAPIRLQTRIVEATLALAEEHDAEVLNPLTVFHGEGGQPAGVMCLIRDPSGFRWMISTLA